MSKIPEGRRFKKGQSGNPAGRPKGSVNLSTRIRNILEGNVQLPDAIAKTIRQAVGADKKALDAMLIVGLLQALQGNEKWCRLLMEHGYGKATQPVEADIETDITIRWANEGEDDDI